MAYDVIKKLPSSDEIINQIPLSAAGYKTVVDNIKQIENILKGEDNRLLIIVGPCSAWPSDAVLEYAKRLAKLNEQVKHALKIVMRVYIQKPRTVKGWTGPINQPDPLLEADIGKGIIYSRELMVKVIEMGLPIADESLFTHNARGFQELLSWVAIGARSSEDQEHRIFASSLDCPVGMKNPTHGSLKIGVNGVVAAQNPHVIAFDGYEIKTHGNPYVHLVLRGGDGKPNYSVEHIAEANEHFIAGNVKNPSIIIDVSHDNCLVNGKKDYKSQPDIIFKVLDSLEDRPDLKPLVKGFMVESFIKEGNQAVKEGTPIDMTGLSITDPCLDWSSTEQLLLNLAKRVAS
ncbi:MAG: 3-deoxy-7-phosphoheptulonate synthase [Burkholderiales bacterium]|jgi:3-deoxy-7-phosphoheptulonate synthase|nr:3-deoxy-7-phosphoheptulonate synthase [Burkholderiales bacterium]